MSDESRAAIVAEYQREAPRLVARDLAALEQRLMARLRPRPGEPIVRSRILASLLGVPEHSIRCRSVLHGYGPAYAELFTKLDEGFAPEAVVRVARVAREKVAALGIPIPEAIRMASSEAETGTRVMLHGRVFFRKRAGLAAAEAPLRARSSPAPELPPIPTPDPSSPRSFWIGIRAAVVAYAKTQLEGVDEMDAKEAIERFVADFEAAQHALTVHVNRLRQAEKRSAVAIARPALADACRALSIDPPRGKKPVDMAKARRVYRELARQYHPDRPGGDAERFRTVQNAFAVLRDYNEKLQETP